MGPILVTGGTGTLGRPLVSLLREQGHDVRVLSRSGRAGTIAGDLTTGEGVAAAANGAEVIVHLASDTHRFGRTDLQQLRHLLALAGGARHLVYVSIVGIDDIGFVYYRRKLACEQAVEQSRLPSTILRATQFHELLGLLLGGAERLPAAPLPLEFRFQTAAAADVATHLAGVVLAEPCGRAPDYGGPEVLTLGSMARTWRSLRGRPRLLWRLPLPGRAAEGFRLGRNTCPGNAHGGQRWEEYVAALGRR